MTTIKLTPQRKRTLVHFIKHEVSGLPMPTMAELGEIHGTTKDSIKTHLKALVRDGVMVVARISRGNRQHEYRLTPEGRRVANVLYQKAAAKAAEIRQTNYRRLLDNFSLGGE